MRFNRDEPVLTYTEQYQTATNGDILQNRWRVVDTGAPRPTVGIEAAPEHNVNNPDRVSANSATQEEFRRRELEEQNRIAPDFDMASDDVQPVAYFDVVIDGNVYQVNGDGSLQRNIPDHPGWIETRDANGDGTISNAQGQVMAVLGGGDSVSSQNDGRIVIQRRRWSHC